jgi:hypothetical protein
VNTIEFVSYSGKYPNLCRGALVLRINGIERTDFHLSSGGSVWFDSEWSENVESGPWSVSVPDDLAHLKNDIEHVVNAHVPEGCCGGCI